MTRFRLAAALGVAILATMLAAPVSAEDPPPAADTVVVDVEDDLLQIALTRLVEEAPEFGSFLACPLVGGTCDAPRNVAISVVRLDNGAHAEVNGDIWEVSASAAKAYWVAVAVNRVGPDAVESLARSIFQRSSNGAASLVIDLVGRQPSVGVDRINEATRGWGLDDTFLRGWYGSRYSSETPYPWGYRNITTTDDLAIFWAGVGSGEVLDALDTAEFLQWAGLPRLPTDGNELIVPRLPAEAGTYYKSGWLYGDPNNPSRRRIGGALITTPSGTDYAIGIAFQARNSTTFGDTGIRFTRYASCEVYNLIAGTGHRCTRRGDPYEIVNHTTAPIGALNTAAAERDQVRVGGWALDRDLGADPVDIRIKVDGDTIGTIVADQLKTSVHDLHGMGNYHGFDATLDADLSPGEHEVCATALNDAPTGVNKVIGCKNVIVSEDWPPAGNMTKAFIDGTRLIVKGTARDEDTPGPIEVKIQVDGIWAAKVSADRGVSGDRFRAVFQAPLAAGDHTVCAIALNHEGAGPNRNIGCRVVESPSDWPPMGSLTSAFVDTGKIIARGWASDLDTSDAIDVGITLDGDPVLRVTADRGPSGHLFRAVTTPSLPGEYEVCAIAFNHTGGDPTTPLGCATVVVPDA